MTTEMILDFYRLLERIESDLAGIKTALTADVPKTTAADALDNIGKLVDEFDDIIPTVE